jgi:hypothetical protein
VSVASKPREVKRGAPFPAPIETYDDDIELLLPVMRDRALARTEL